MLTKKQLEDAARRCLKFDCWKCVNSTLCNRPGGATQESAKTALAYREMLERLEWIPEELGGHCCLICGGTKAIGHTYGCELAAILGESEVGDDGKNDLYKQTNRQL